MQKKIMLFFILAMAALMSLALVNASFKYHSNNIKKNYNTGEIISGKLILNLTNENSKNIFSTNFQGNITLIDLIKKSSLTEGKDYACSTARCAEEYELGDAITEIEINGEKIIGLKILKGSVSGIKLLEFSAKSSLASSCEIPLTIDVAADGQNSVSSLGYTFNVCSENNYGCFSQALESSSYSEGIIDGEVCEKIALGPAPAYKLGAKIKNETNKNITMILRDEAENELGKCILSQPKGMQEVECIVKSGSAEQANFSVCASGNFRIRSEAEGKICGSEEADFEIFAKRMEYSSSPISVNNSLFESLDYGSLEDEVYDYLKSNYEKDGNVICDPYCIVPIKLKGPAQNINLENIKFQYSRGSINYDAPNEFYKMNTKPATITANAIALELAHANFKIPLKSTEKNFKLLLGDKLVFIENISLEEGFDFDISPRFAFFSMDTQFTVKSNFNIISSKWNFGDGTLEEVKGKAISHKYDELKTFTMQVEIIRNDSKRSSKSFQIIVGNPKESAAIALKDYKARIANISADINNFPGWIKEKIGPYDVGSFGKSISQIEVKFANASSDADYTSIINQLSQLDIPNSISTTKSGKVPLAIGFENINPQYYAEIVKEDSPESSKIKALLIGWFNSHYSSEVEFDKVSALSLNDEKSILTTFKFSLAPKEKEGAYLIIDYPFESITFMKNYGQKPLSEGSGAYIPIKAEKQEIELLVEDELEVSQLGAYISPMRKLAISSAEICEDGDPECTPEFPWGKLIIWLAVIFAFFILLYLILQEWYKRYYENYLFKDKRDLYNLINFIYNSRNNGLKDADIKKKLKENSWKGERISYAFKKLDGKRTGMWEIPLFKSAERRKVMDEIAKRQNTDSARFIKQPRF